MNQSIILLTYKGKVLLMHKDYILATLGEDPWHFIFGVKEKNESFEETIKREVEKETGIQLKSVDFLSSLDDSVEKKYFYHTHLTDDNVNNIVRRDGKILGFFSLKELDTLSLSLATKLLIRRHRDLLAKTSQI
ncbi:MAG: NUDIX hydrolase [Candidatus Levybacteria bacterium]|nr:NUDIX hydrolase [Candidatus Levybacteria bacterium]